MKRTAPKHKRENIREPPYLDDQQSGIVKLYSSERLPVSLCWIRKRKGRSRTISSTAIRENMTAAKNNETERGKGQCWVYVGTPFGPLTLSSNSSPDTFFS